MPPGGFSPSASLGNGPLFPSQLAQKKCLQEGRWLWVKYFLCKCEDLCSNSTCKARCGRMHLHSNCSYSEMGGRQENALKHKNHIVWLYTTANNKETLSQTGSKVGTESQGPSSDLCTCAHTHRNAYKHMHTHMSHTYRF